MHSSGSSHNVSHFQSGAQAAQTVAQVGLLATLGIIFKRICSFFSKLDLTENIAQLKHEAALSWTPKLLFLGGLRGFGGSAPTLKENLQAMWTTISDELFVEVQEAAACYFVPSIFGSLFALLANQFIKMPDHMIAGEPYKGVLSKKVGEFIEVGKGGKAGRYKLTEEVFHKAVRVKFFAVMMTAALGAFIEACAPTVQNLLSLKFLKSGSFLKLSGVPLNRTPEQEAEQDQFTFDRSTDFLKKATGVLLTGLLAITGLTFLGGRKTGFLNTKQMGKALHYLDFSKGFELSRALLLVIFGQGLWSYPAGARPEIIYKEDKKSLINPEFWECLWRASVWVIPAALVMKDQMNNFLAWLFVGRPNKIEVLTPLDQMFKENPFFDYKRVKAERIKQLPEFTKLPGAKQEKILGQLRKIESTYIFAGVFTISMIINTINFLRTKAMSQASQEVGLAAGQQAEDYYEDLEFVRGLRSQKDKKTN